MTIAKEVPLSLSLSAVMHFFGTNSTIDTVADFNVLYSLFISKYTERSKKTLVFIFWHVVIIKFILQV